jgi:hypothetical protein
VIEGTMRKTNRRLGRIENIVRPGDNGTKKLVWKYGSDLVAVRYHYDRKRRLAYKTIELIIDRWPIKK